MATDPQMLQSWYADFQKDKGATTPAQTTAAPAPAPEGGGGGGGGSGMLGLAMNAITKKGGFQQPAQATTTEWKPDANSTVAGQFNGLIKTGSPLMDQATTAAKQGSAQRGLLNSTMAITAGQDAAYRAALPIAQQDANTFASAGQFNAGAANTTSQFNAGATNEVGMQREGFAQQDKLQAGDFAQQNKTQAADLASRYDLANMDVQSRAALQQADAANQMKLQQANAELQKGLAATDAAVKQSMQVYDAQVKQAMQGLDNQSKLQLATLDAENRTALMAVEAKYKNELQASQSMAASYQSMVDGMSRIMVSPDMDAAAKQKAIGNLTTLYNNALQMQSDVSGLELGSLLAPEAVGGTPAPAPGAAPPPAPSQADDLLGWWEHPGGA